MIAVLVFANWARSGDVRAIFLCCPSGLTTYKVEGQIVSQNEQGVVMRDRAGTEYDISGDLLKSVEEVKKNTLYESIFHNKWLLVCLTGRPRVDVLGNGLIMPNAGTGRVLMGLCVQILPLLLAES
jgi:hypothetical protein